MKKHFYGGLDETFWIHKPLIGMVHLHPLPGSPRDMPHIHHGEMPSGFQQTLDHALADAFALAEGGADALIVENYGDTPFCRDTVPPHTIAAMTRAISLVRESVSIPVGVNVLRNDVKSAIAIAHICGASFVRVNVFVGASITDQGIIQGAAREAILYRKELNADVAIWADIFVKHASQLGDGIIEDAAKDAAYRGMADAIIVSGSATGSPTNPDDLKRVKAVVSKTPVIVGSGFTPETAHDLLKNADGAIVGTYLKVDGQMDSPVDLARVRSVRDLMSAAIKPR